MVQGTKELMTLCGSNKKLSIKKNNNNNNFSGVPSESTLLLKSSPNGTLGAQVQEAYCLSKVSSFWKDVGTVWQMFKL